MFFEFSKKYFSFRSYFIINYLFIKIFHYKLFTLLIIYDRTYGTQCIFVLCCLCCLSTESRRLTPRLTYSTIHLHHSIFQALLFIWIRKKVNDAMYYVYSDKLSCRIYSILGVFQSELGSNIMLILSCLSASSEVISLTLQDQFRQNSVLETYTKFCGCTLFSD
jgi:hypothetical protein